MIQAGKQHAELVAQTTAKHTPFQVKLIQLAVLARSARSRSGRGAESTHTTLANLWKAERLPLGAAALPLPQPAFFLQTAFPARVLRRTAAVQSDRCALHGNHGQRLLQDADSWAMWTNYQTAFVLLTLGVNLYGFALYALLFLDLAALRKP
jgi:hypothetical protein